MPGLVHSRALRTDVDARGRPLSASEREKLLRPYLPATPQNRSPDLSHTSSPSRQKRPAGHRQRVRPLIKQALHALIYTLISLLFSVWVRIRRAKNQLWNKILALMYYHHRSPEMIRKDVGGLKKVPQHLSVILSLSGAEQHTGRSKERRRSSVEGMEQLLSDACEIVAWSASAGIPTLSIYERSGLLKAAMPLVDRRIARTLTDYYGSASRHKPTFSVRAPNMQGQTPPESPETQVNGMTNGDGAHPSHINILLLDATDGRQTLVDLTRTLASMSQQQKIAPSDISQELIDAEISESVMGEPDLLITFGDRVVLDGYPPWQVRLTEIYHVQDNMGGVSYGVFLRGLMSFAGAQMRFGR